MELGEDSSAQRAKGKRERAEKEGRKGGREGGKRDGMEEKGREGMRDRVASSGAQDPKFRLSFQDPPVKSSRAG